jgi:hypothetical protein
MIMVPEGVSTFTNCHELTLSQTTPSLQILATWLLGVIEMASAIALALVTLGLRTVALVVLVWTHPPGASA